MELLFRTFLKAQCRENGLAPLTVSPDALALLRQYPFRGNIRELKNMAERACVLHTGTVISQDSLREILYPKDLDPESFTPAPAPSSEPERLREALNACGGNRTKAAKLLGMDRSTLWRKLQKYQIS